MFNSLRNRLSLFFISLAVLPILTVSVILAQQSFTTLEQEARDSQQQVAQALGTEITAFVLDREEELRLVSGVNELGTLDTRDQRRVLNNLLAHQQLYLEIALLDATGQELFRLSRLGIVPEADLENLAESDEYVIPATEGTAFYSPIYLGETEREPLITIAIPVFDPFTDDLNSVLVADFRFRTIWDLIADMDFGDEEDLYVIDTDGNVIAHSDPLVVFNSTQIDLPAEDGRATGLSGNEVIFARDTLQFGDEQLIVVAEQSVSEALALATNTITIAAVITAVALIIAVGLVILTVRRVVRPIERLSSVARNIQQGDLSLRAEVTTEDEIGELARAFNDMTQQLDALVGTLEERVAARTRDLQLAADVSKQINTLLSLDELLKQVVSLTSTSFNFYSTAVYLFSERHKALIRATGADAKGEPMIVPELQRVAIDLQPSLIAEAARARQAMVVNDITQSDSFLPLASLPNTRSELALPLLAKNELLGIFDLQSETINRFSPEVINVLSTLADQIAIAVRNANLFTDAEAARVAAEEANQIKSKFLANMSHELRTPLNSILNFTELVADGDLGEVNEGQVEALKEVVDNGTHLLSLINDILDVTKIEVGMMELFIQDVDINALLESVMSTAKVLVKDKPTVEIILNAEPDLPVIVGDRRRIRQILLNLIANAVKFTNEGSITIGAKRANSHIQFTVKDTGFGIAPEDQATIFDSFKQAKPGMLASSGAGLGLAISKHLAELHGGTIWLESEIGKGTTFFVTIEIRQPETAA